MNHTSLQPLWASMCWRSGFSACLASMPMCPLSWLCALICYLHPIDNLHVLCTLPCHGTLFPHSSSCKSLASTHAYRRELWAISHSIIFLHLGRRSFERIAPSASCVVNVCASWSPKRSTRLSMYDCFETETIFLVEVVLHLNSQIPLW